jgi:hypothetical protein
MLDVWDPRDGVELWAGDFVEWVEVEAMYDFT